MEQMNIIELVMIVKNSGESIRMTLRTVKPYISHWTICDTGSSDNTPSIIQEELNNITGNLYNIPTSDFSTMRNKSIELSSKTCRYLIILDDSYVLHACEGLLEFLKTSEEPYMSIKIGELNNKIIEDSYHSIRLIKTDCCPPDPYRGRVHESIHHNSVHLPSSLCFINDIKSQEHTIRSQQRYFRDIEYLLEDHKDNPTIPRTLYYIGRTYCLLDKFNEASDSFRKLSEIKDLHPDYLFSSLYERASIRHSKLNQLTSEQFIEECKRINTLFPTRVEPLYKSFMVLYERGEPSDLPVLTRQIETLLSFPPYESELIIIESLIQNYYIPYLYVDIHLKIGKFDKARVVLDRLLSMYPYDQPLRNIKYSIETIKNVKYNRYQQKVIVFHTGNIFTWDPTDFKKNQRVSGSEIMAANLAREFAKLPEWKVVLVGSFMEDVYHKDNVEFMSIKRYQEFSETFYIDYLISSRFVCNLTYRANIKSVYLWVHDVLPMLGKDALVFQTHPEHFKGIITLGNWHKEKVINEMGIPSEYVKVSRNAIVPERFLIKNSPQKIPYRFIYTSCALRGLGWALEIIQEIHKTFPETTLVIFTNLANVKPDDANIIKKLPYISLNARVSQEQLSNELLQSMVWLYPTDFNETYCISAVEAMAAGCLVVSVDLAGLKDTLGINRAVVVSGSGSDIRTRRKLGRTLQMMLNNPELTDKIRLAGMEWAQQQTYQKLVGEWIELFDQNY